MANIVASAAFTREIFSAKMPGHTDKPSPAQVAQDFAAILGRMMSRSMMQSASDSDDGFLGLGTGAAGDIYSGFMEQAVHWGLC